MTTVRVALEARSYDVRIAPGLIDEAGVLLSPYARDGRLVVVSDETVWTAQGQRLTAGLERGGIAPLPLLVSPGEVSKSWAVLEDLTNRLLSERIARGDHILAFGGGMVGDLAGFAAAIVKRGCGIVQMPTSLLAQVDSSVGGKTGINAAAGKNMIGAFHQPAAVLIDPTCLATLPERELRAGYAELVKYGLIGDADFFAWCEANGAALLAGDLDAIAHAIAVSVAAKAAIVAEDERETLGRRALLNLGHSFGHALEAEAGYSERLLHGEAVAAGMALAFRLSAALGHCGRADAERVAAHLAAVGLPTTLDEAGSHASAEDLAALMLHDKKASGDALTLVLAHGIGAAFVEHGVAPEGVAQFLRTEGAA
ncbi:3-dehydroquinate synthase [Allosphingosinicella indica]|uniref:3-dehydroquinate synthase n=1 Tax=Allosphingosinicella indica TaxID=941907 RepID=UPI00155FB8F5|nr:3-dehydroquinate synthase [Allosphingosinicella indica]